MVSAKVLFEYEAEQPDELTLVVGQVINNVCQQDGGWWEGEVNGKRGVFPENFVEVIKDTISLPQPSTPTNAKTASTVKKARVAFEYDPEQDDELVLNVGEIVEILEDSDDGWWKGRLNGKVGVFPSNFVEVIKEETKSSLPALPTIPPPLPSSPPALLPQLPTSTDTEITEVKERPKSQVGGVGFGLTLGDLSRNKLKKVGKETEDHKKPTQKVTPLEPSKLESLKPVAAPHQSFPQSVQPSASKTIQKALVTYAYEPELDDELALTVGDIVTITNTKVFEGWLEGELKGKVGFFPDNFVELLPIETIKEESGLEIPKSLFSKSSVKRAAKENPSKSEPKESTEKQKPPVGVMASDNSNLRQELETKLSANSQIDPKKGKLPPPPGNKPKPSIPTQLKPKPPAPIPPKSESDAAAPQKFLGIQLPRTGSMSTPKSSLVTPEKETSKKDTVQPTGKKEVSEIPPEESKLNKKDSVDLDSIKPTDPLKHMQRAKAPGKNLPSIYRHIENADDVDGLKSQITLLADKMADMEKRFKLLISQVTDDLDNERKIRLNQQVELDRLKKQLALLTDHYDN